MNKPIRLFWNECYAPKPVVAEAVIARAVQRALETVSLYPGELYDDVVSIIASDLQVGENQVLLGHGVEGLLHLISQAFLGGNKVGGTCKPSFFAFNNNIERSRSLYYPAHFSRKVDLKDFVRKIKGADVFFLASPNKETGNYLLSKGQIEKVLRSYKGMFIVDECYFGLGQKTVISLLEKYKNLIILRSVSKAEGLASLRVGILIAQAEVISKLKYYQNDIEYDPINTLALQIIKDVYPHFPSIWKYSRKFFSDFYNQLKQHFPKHKIIRTVTTHHFFDVKPSKIETFKVIEKMNESGYLLSPQTPRDNNSRFTFFEDKLMLTPPPIEYWGDYFSALSRALGKK